MKLAVELSQAGRLPRLVQRFLREEAEQLMQGVFGYVMEQDLLAAACVIDMIREKEEASRSKLPPLRAFVQGKEAWTEVPSGVSLLELVKQASVIVAEPNRNYVPMAVVVFEAESLEGIGKAPRVSRGL